MYSSTQTEDKATITRIVKCRICGRWLSNPVSVERGIGPVCWARIQKGELVEKDEKDEQG